MRKVVKGWGSETIWADEPKYCGKFLDFNQGSKFSMHLHRDKDETWYVLSGKFKLHIIGTKNAKHVQKIIQTGDVWRNAPMVPHQLECIEEGRIIEVSTYDDPEDNYRVMPGDSQ